MILLTIIVPTYNRVANLTLLLNSLASDLVHYQSNIQLIVGDNCSTDETQKVLMEFQSKYPFVISLRHETNVGPEENFCLCLERVQSRYFWIIGDDDLPKAGVVKKLLDLLNEQMPDLVSMGSEWLLAIKGPSQGKAVLALKPRMVGRLDFAKEVNVWMTFISGIVINRELFLAHQDLSSIRRCMGTQLIQLGWIFPVLAAGERFVVIRETCVLATAGNSGGFQLMTVFGVNFPKIARSILGEKSPEAHAIIQRTLFGFLPGLAWNTKRGAIGNYLKEDAWAELRSTLGQYPIFWLTLFPIMRLPLAIAMPWYAGVRILSKLGNLIGLR